MGSCDIWQDRPRIINLKRIENKDWRPTIFHIEKWGQILYIAPSCEMNKNIQPLNEAAKDPENFINLSFYNEEDYHLVHQKCIERRDNSIEYKSCSLVKELSQEYLLNGDECQKSVTEDSTEQIYLAMHSEEPEDSECKILKVEMAETSQVKQKII